MLDRSRFNLGEAIAPLSPLEKRKALADIVRCHGEWRGHEIIGSDRLEAMQLDNDLAGHGAAARLKRELAKAAPLASAEELASFMRAAFSEMGVQS